MTRGKFVRVTERDLFAFAWLTEHQCIYQRDVRVLVGHWDGSTPTDGAARQMVDRWRKGGYATARKVLHSRPRIITLTPAGAALVGVVDWKPTHSWQQAEAAHELLLEGPS